MVCDPTSPNILQFRAGQEVNQLLSRPFFVELQSRYGNLYYVREEVPQHNINLICPLHTAGYVVPQHQALSADVL